MSYPDLGDYPPIIGQRSMDFRAATRFTNSLVWPAQSQKGIKTRTYGLRQKGIHNGNFWLDSCEAVSLDAALRIFRVRWCSPELDAARVRPR